MYKHVNREKGPPFGPIRLIALSSLPRHCHSRICRPEVAAEVVSEKRLRRISPDKRPPARSLFGIGQLRRFPRTKLARDACFAFSSNGMTPITGNITSYNNRGARCAKEGAGVRARARKVRQLHRNTGGGGARSRFVSSPRRRKRGVRSHD